MLVSNLDEDGREDLEDRLSAPTPRLMRSVRNVNGAANARFVNSWAEKWRQ